MEDLGDAEIEQLGRAVVGHQDVAGLDVAVHHPEPVRELDRGADRAEELAGARRRLRRRSSQ